MRYLLMTVLTLSAGFALAEPVPGAASTLDDRIDVSVTAYNSGLALVRDTRKLLLPEGEFDLRFGDVAEQIQPETVSLRSRKAPATVAVYEQNYEYDLISPSKLMDKYVGKEIRLVNLHKDFGFHEVAGTLLSNNEGPVFQINGDIYLGHPGHVVLPEVPENLIARPSLIWRLANTLPEQELEVSYLTHGIGWKADYVLTIPRKSATLDLAGWVTLDNRSGATYTNALLKLVAGEVNRAAPPAPKMMRSMDAVGYMAAEAAPMAQQEAFGDFHLYTMPRRTTIRQNQSKQLALLDGSEVPYVRKYEIRGDGGYFRSQGYSIENQHAAVFLEFKNNEGAGLGVPLPAGVMRIYEEDSSGALQFAGEDRIQHTPRDEEVSLRMGEAFDIVYDRRQMSFERVSQNTFRSSYEIEIRNRKDEAATIEVVERIHGQWRILKESVDHVKKDAFTVLFPVPVPANETVTLSYEVLVTY